MQACTQYSLEQQAEVQQLQFDLHAYSTSAEAALASERAERERLAAELGQVGCLNHKLLRAP